ncbi:ATP-binding protein [Streptomyces sp. NPDC020707]|jgi:anti-sigma regulatory factor (Ser/Thr protein kinase)|uniref:ATP-binding protein n=1 Tax=Streptomyces ortus TaxID=2867268 RepID=A0ABT3VAR1_9ACTN|nr:MULTISPECIES: ATP-binding protein [Streptomyces]MCX4237042.1 ATP-binding protein [Streptomyces ortus]
MNGSALHEPHAPASWRIALPHSVAAVPVARALVRTALAEIELTADCDTAELLTAELVANAVEHTRGDAPIELVVELLPTGCQVEVHDPDPSPPGDLTVPDPSCEPDPWLEHGRGLLLIRTLSSSCGHRPTESGKAVWFRLPVVPHQRRSA